MRLLMPKMLGANLLCGLAILALALCVAVPADCAWQPFTGAKAAKLQETLLTTTTSDPTGDTFGSGGVQIDITSLSVEYSPTDLIVSLLFNDSISLPDSGQPNAVTGYIDLDTDRNPVTGVLSHIDIYSPYASDLGVDYYVDLSVTGYSSTTQDAAFYDSTGNLIGRISVIFTSNSFLMRIPLALLGGSNGVNSATVMGTVDEATDAAPNGGFVTSLRQTSVVPTFSQWGMMLFFLFLAASMFRAIRRRRVGLRF